MKRSRLLLIALFATMLAGVTSYGIFKILRNALIAQGEQVNVVMAASDVPVGTLLQPRHLKLGRTTRAALPRGYFTRIEDVVNRGLLVQVADNEVIIDSKLASREAGAGLPAMIPDGMRAVSVKVNDVVSVAGFVQPGTRVDVLVTGDPNSARELQDVTTTTVLENVQVLAAGTQLQQNSKGEAQSVPVITLLVNPEDAQRLTLAANEGKIQLSLRNPLDHEVKTPAAFKNAQIYGWKKAPPEPKKAAQKVAKQVVPAPKPQMTYVVEMIRGDKRDEAKF